MRNSQDETRTDHLGHFSMPALFKRSIARFLPQQFAVGQSLVTERNGELEGFHSGVKRKPEEATDGRGKALEVTCDLSEKRAPFIINGNTFVSKCRWACRA